MYDFANSSYTTLISTVAFSSYFRLAVVGDDARGDFYWSLTAALAHAALIGVSPMLGALADYSGRKKRFLLISTIVTVIGCAMLGTVTPGSIGWAILVFVLATIAFEAGYIFYNAFLPEISTPKTMGRISAWSWGTGFLGGLLALVACFPFLAKPLLDEGGALDDVAVVNWRWSFVVVAGFFALFAIPTFIFLKERGTPSGDSRQSMFRAGLVRLLESAQAFREPGDARLYLLAYLFFYGGIETVIKFAAIYATITFGIQGEELISLFIVTNLIAVPGTLIAGYLADRFGSRNALMGTLVAWILLLIWGAVAQSSIGFWILAGGIATGMGATQAVGRTVMAQLSPPDRLSEYFGYNLLAGRFGSILALVAFGFVSSSTGSQRTAVFWLIPPFVVGIWILSRIRDRRVMTNM